MRPMRSWTPQTLYDAKPWGLAGTGVVLALGSIGWSLSAGVWTVWRSLLCFAGVALTIIGGITLQMRQDYRARSKWRRAGRP
jgi:protein-S-isoprenylcysteine O-methyltransferase Ste14